jgi:putative FmdB family regulatory protein
MPTYDYVCDACKHEFELFQSIKAEPEKKCPECGKKKLRRLIGPGAAIMFKGSGFYITDYRSDSYKKGAEADKSASSGDKPTVDLPKHDSKSVLKGDVKVDSKSESTAKKSDSGKTKKSKD